MYTRSIQDDDRIESSPCTSTTTLDISLAALPPPDAVAKVGRGVASRSPGHGLLQVARRRALTATLA